MLHIFIASSIAFSPVHGGPAGRGNPARAQTKAFVQASCPIEGPGYGMYIYDSPMITSSREVGIVEGAIGWWLGELDESADGRQQLTILNGDVSGPVKSGDIAAEYGSMRHDFLIQGWPVPDNVVNSAKSFALETCAGSRNRPDESFRRVGACPLSREPGDLAFPSSSPADAIRTEREAGVMIGNSGFWIGCIYDTGGGHHYFQEYGSAAVARMPGRGTDVFSALQATWRASEKGQDSTGYPLDSLTIDSHYYIVPLPAPGRLKKPTQPRGSCYGSREPGLAAIPKSGQTSAISTVSEVGMDIPGGGYETVGLVYTDHRGESYFGPVRGAMAVTPMHNPSDVYDALDDLYNDLHVPWISRPFSLKFVSRSTKFYIVRCIESK